MFIDKIQNIVILIEYDVLRSKSPIEKNRILLGAEEQHFAEQEFKVSVI